jgi:hypothetical protein
MLSSPVYAELDPRQHLLPPSAASAPSAFSQPSNFQPSNRLRSNSFPCHTSGKCAHNSCVCHTPKNTRSKVLCLPHIRKTGGWGSLNPTEDPIIASCIQRHFGKWRTDSPLAEHTSMHGGNPGNWLKSAPEPFLVSSNRTFWPRRYRLSGKYVLGVLPAARNK